MSIGTGTGSHQDFEMIKGTFSIVYILLHIFAIAMTLSVDIYFCNSCTFSLIFPCKKADFKESPKHWCRKTCFLLKARLVPVS